MTGRHASEKGEKNKPPDVFMRTGVEENILTSEILNVNHRTFTVSIDYPRSQRREQNTQRPILRELR